MATYTEERTAQERRQENYDILYKNASMRSTSAPKKEEFAYSGVDESAKRRSANDYKNNMGYFSYSPYKTHKVERAEAKVEKTEMPSTLYVSDYAEPKQPVAQPQASAPVMRTAAPAIHRITRIDDAVVDTFEPAYEVAPAKAATKQKLVKKNSYRYEEDNSLSLSTNMKVILALVASIVIIAFTVIFVNSALLNTLEMQTNAVYTAVTQMAEQSEGLVASITQATGIDAAAEYAASVGMILG